MSVLLRACQSAAKLFGDQATREQWLDSPGTANLCDEVENLKEQLAALSGVNTLNFVTEPCYEYRDIWAEESGAVNAGSAEWSFGNGATGFMGLPIDDGWEIEAMYFHADTYAALSTIQVDLMNYGNTPSNAGANTIASISLSSAVDGGGVTGNAYKYEELASPVVIPVTGDSTVIGFITREASAGISDARVGARLRRKIKDVIVSVTLGEADGGA